MSERSPEKIDHPAHYGGADNPYEAIKVIEAWGLDFCLGNSVKYISRAGKKPGEHELDDLKKALWYLLRRIGQLERRAINTGDMVTDEEPYIRVIGIENYALIVAGRILSQADNIDALQGLLTAARKTWKEKHP